MSKITINKQKQAIANKARKLLLKTGDMVQIISGDDKGKVGKILKVVKKKLSIIVENVNLKKKFIQDNEGKKMVSLPYPIGVHKVKKVK